LRNDNRQPDELRKVRIKTSFMKNAFGSCLIEMGDTKVICSASVEDRVPPFLKGKGSGWVTAEYAMIPASCTERIPRESVKGRPSGRTQEIQRLIGRSMRAVVDMNKLGEKTILLDADVLQGDGGTRTASITGCFIALAEAVEKLREDRRIIESPILDYVAAVSVGMIDGKPMLDLNYQEDSRAEVDMNVVMTSAGNYVEVQGTAEKKPYTKKEMDAMLGLAKTGIMQLIRLQKRTVRI